MGTKKNHPGGSEVGTAPALARPPAAVVVLGGDAVVGRALELLLHNADHSVTFVALTSVGASRALDGARVLLLAPGLGEKDRRAVLASVGGEPHTTAIPVLELVTGARTSRLGKGTCSCLGPAGPRT